MDLGGFLTELRTTDTYKYLGKIEKIVGMTIEASGPLCSIGDVCRIYTKDMKSHIPAEVVGFNEHKVLLMPYTDLEGIGPGSIVDNTGDKLNVRAGDKLIGRIIDALGNPLDDGEPIEYTDTVPIAGIPVNPLTRPKIHEPIELGQGAEYGYLCRLWSRQVDAYGYDRTKGKGRSQRYSACRRAWQRGKRIYRKRPRRRGYGEISRCCRNIGSTCDDEK